MRRSVPRRQHEQILAAEKLRHQQELDQVKARLNEALARINALTADVARVKGERDQFKQDRDAQRDATRAARTQLAKYENGLTTEVPAYDPAAERKAIDAWEQQVKAWEAWAPGEDDQPGAEGVSRRPTHPALILRRALDHCRALEARLATAEGRKPGAVL